MSRIGKLPITLPKGVEVKIDGQQVTVKGPKGTLTRSFSPEIAIKIDNGMIHVERPNDEPRIRALHGTTRALLNNMIVGCDKGFVRVLEFNGVGYKAEVSGKDLILNGLLYPVKFQPLKGLPLKLTPRRDKVMGHDRQQVGRRLRRAKSDRQNATTVRSAQVVQKLFGAGRTGK